MQESSSLLPWLVALALHAHDGFFVCLFRGRRTCFNSNLVLHELFFVAWMQRYCVDFVPLILEIAPLSSRVSASALCKFLSLKETEATFLPMERSISTPFLAIRVKQL